MCNPQMYLKGLMSDEQIIEFCDHVRGCHRCWPVVALARRKPENYRKPQKSRQLSDWVINS